MKYTAALAAGASLFVIAVNASVVFAQAADTKVNPEDIIVTGTRAKGRTVLDSPVPVDVLSSEALARSGGIAGDLGSALQNLAPAFNITRQSQSGPADHVRAAQLRGLSPDQTLVLVNGKRRHTTAVVNLEAKIGRGTTPVDLNTIAPSAIRRVEILRDGAGAQYGSDAIAGVINILLDNRDSGIEASAGYGLYVTNFEPTGRTIRDGRTFNANASAGFKVDGGFVRIGADYVKRDPTVRGGLGQIFGDATGGFPAAATPRNLALLDRVIFQPGDGKADSLNLWYNYEYTLTDVIRVYGFGTFNNRKTTGVGFFRFPDSDDNVLALYPNGFLPISTGKTQDTAGTIGLKGDIGKVALDGSITFGRNKFDFGVRNSLNTALGRASPTQFFLGRYTFNQLSANLDGTTTLGSVFAAFGAEYRRESFKTAPGDVASYQPGSGSVAYRGLRPTDVANTKRDVFAAYGEISNPDADKFFWNLAGRFENYSDFGSRVAGKASVRYEIRDTIAVRGAISNSLRAPSLSQNSFRQSVTTFAAGSNIPQVVGTVPVSDPVARSLGAADLKPETSLNLSLGATAKPNDNLSFSVDFFNIGVKNRITLSSNIDDGNGSIVNFFTNAVNTNTWGFEVVGGYKAPVAEGTLDLSAAFALAINKINKVNVPLSQFTLEERNTLTEASPQTKLILTASWSDEKFTFLLRGTRYGSVRRVFDFFPEGANTYPAETQVDLEVEYRPLPFLALSLGSTNLLDNYPTRQDDNYNFAGNFPYDPISPLGINGRYVYGRAKVSF
jgi:iron complex outermembrane recepter protein